MRIDKSFFKRNAVLLKILLSTMIRMDYRKYRKEIVFLLRHGLNTYPYDYILNYSLDSEKLYKDISGSYVIHKGKKLYFPNSEKYSEDIILRTHLLSNMEQDIESPHRYLDINEDMMDVVFFDIGCQEASLPLEFVDKLKHLYLFEAEREWNRPLLSTFDEWKNKVTLVNKYVGNKCSNNEIKISDYILNLVDSGKLNLEKDRIFIKMDIEGAEESVFSDLVQIMPMIKRLSLAICVYHKSNTEQRIIEMMPEGYTVRQRETYMLFDPFGKDFRYPYFRHGIVRIERVSEK